MTQAEIENMIQLYIDAEKAVLQGKSVTFNGQSMTMVDLGEITKARERWERRLVRYIAGKRGRPEYKLARFV